MPITLSSTTFVNIHNSQSFLIGNSGHDFTFSGTLTTNVGLTSTSNLSVMVSGSDELTLNSGNWADYGILVGNSIDLDAINTGTDLNATVTITEINGNILKHDGDLSAFLFTMFPSPDFGQMVVVNNTYSDIDQLDVFFNLVPNNSQGSIESLIDGEVNRIRFNGISAMSATDTVTGVLLGNKSGGAITSATLTKDSANTYTLDIEFFNWLDYVELNPNEVPSYYLANESIKPYFKFEGKVVAGNPNSTITSVENSQLGNVGYIGENYNQGVDAFTPISVTITTDDGQELDDIDHTQPTTVEIVIGREGLVNINANKFITKIQHLPTTESYKNNANSYLENTYQSVIKRDTSYTKLAYGVGGAQLVISDEFVTTGSTVIDTVTYQTLTIRFKITPNSAYTDYFNSLDESDRVYRIVSTVQSGELVDDVTIQNKLGNFVSAPILGGIAEEVQDWNFYNHYQVGNEAQGTEYNTLTEDDTLTTAVLKLNKADDYESLAFKIKVIDGNENSFDLFSRVIPMNNYPLNAENVRLVNLTEQLDYLLPSTDRNTFELVIGTIDSTTYDINFKHTFLNSWRYWLAQANALNTFLDPTLPNNGLNNEWVRYMDGGTIQYAIEIVKNGTTFTAQQNIEILDYDVSADVTSTIYLEDTLGNSLPAVVDGQDVVVIADHEGTSAWDVNDTWGWIAYRPKEAEKRKIISSKWNDNGNNLPLRPLSGETKAQLTFPTPTVARLKALVKGSEIADNYTFVSRINSPFTAPLLDYFIFDVRTFNTGTSAFNQFTLPLRSGYTYDFQVEWGDGSIEYYAGVAGTDIPNNITHSYSPILLKPRDWITRIKIGVTNNTGFPTIYFNNGGDKDKLINTVDYNDVGWTTLENSFRGCSNNNIESTATANFNAVLNADSAWANNNLTSFPAIDLSSATILTSAWLNNDLTSFPAIDLSSATILSGAWLNNDLTSFPAIDFTSGTNFDGAWKNNNLTSFPNIDLSSAIDVAGAWEKNSLTAFPAIDLSSAVSARQAWFDNNLTSFPLIDLSNCLNLTSAWLNNNLDSFPALNLSSASNLTSAWRNNGVISTFSCRNFYAMTNGTSCFQGTTLATADYSDILITQRANNANTSVTFDGGSSTYNVAGGVARGELVSIQSWSIVDGGAE
jgi:hypothetical protein